MRRLLRHRPSPALAIAIAALLLAGTGAAMATIPNPDGSVDLCYQKVHGNLRVIDTDAGQSCKPSEAELSLGNFDGAVAGGDLTGTYPNPEIANGAVGADEVADGSIGTSEFSKSIPAVRVFHSASQTTADNSSAFLAFNSEEYDTANMHDNSTNNSRLTAPVTGVYLITAEATWAASPNGLRSISINKNGTIPIAGDSRPPNTAPGAQTTGHVATVVLLQAGDYVEVVAYQTSGGNLDIEAPPASFPPKFTMTWVAPGP